MKKIIKISGPQQQEFENRLEKVFSNIAEENIDNSKLAIQSIEPSIINLRFICKNYCNIISEKIVSENIDIFILFPDIICDILKNKYLSEDILNIIIDKFIKYNNSQINNAIYKFKNSTEILQHISKYQKLSLDFFEKHIDNINIKWFAENKNINEYIFAKYKKDICNYINYLDIKYLTEDIIEEFYNNIDWSKLSSNENIPINIFTKYKNQLCRYLNNLHVKYLTEDIIEKYKDKIDWEYISLYKDLTSEFIRTNIQYLNVKRLINNERLNDEVKEWIKLYETIG